MATSSMSRSDTMNWAALQTPLDQHLELEQQLDLQTPPVQGLQQPQQPQQQLQQPPQREKTPRDIAASLGWGGYERLLAPEAVHNADAQARVQHNVAVVHARLLAKQEQQQQQQQQLEHEEKARVDLLQLQLRAEAEAELAQQQAQAQAQEQAQEQEQEQARAARRTEKKEKKEKTEREVKDYTQAATYAATTVAPHEAFTLSPDAYTSQALYELEQERVFGKAWVCIGLTEQVRQAGETLVADVGGQPVFAVRDKHGALNGFLNVCRHRGSKLVRAAGRYPVISCPYHRWGYALDGRLLATPMWDTVEGGERYDKKSGALKAKKAPRKRISDEEAVRRAEAAEQRASAQHQSSAQSSAQKHQSSAQQHQSSAQQQQQQQSSAGPGLAGGPCAQMDAITAAFDTAHMKAFDKQDYALFKVRVETWGCFVFASLAPEAEVPALARCLGDVPAGLANYPLHELVSVRSKTYASQANWKLLAENFMEYYHLPSVHPALAEISRVDDHHRRQGHGQYVGFETHPLTSAGTPLDPEVLPSLPGLDAKEKVTGVFHQLFPNVFYFLLNSHIFVVRLEPKGPGVTVEHADLLVHPSLLGDAATEAETEAINAKLDAMMAFYDMTNLEDIDICENVQDGVRAAAYQGGRVSFRFEETIHRFQNILVDHLTGNPGRVPKGDADIPFYLGGKPDDQAAPQLHVD